MSRPLRALWTLSLAAASAMAQELTLVTLDPAHSHAVQIYSARLDGFSRQSRVYAPLSRDIAVFWNSITQLASRRGQPDRFWEFSSFTGSGFLEQFRRDQQNLPAGTGVLSLSGRNSVKLGYIRAGVEAGMHVLADKPWVIEASQLPLLRETVEQARQRNLILYDCMTQRFDIAYQLQRALVHSADVLGTLNPGTPEQPAVRMRSSHLLLKSTPRPVWFFDLSQQGEALTDVGTHVVDLAHWTLFPNEALTPERDITLVSARRWPTPITLDQFRRITATPASAAFPDFVPASERRDRFDYWTNNQLLYQARGRYIQLETVWDAEPSSSVTSDTMFAEYRGTRASIITRDRSYRPELEVQAHQDPEAVRAALEGALRRFAGPPYNWPGLTIDATRSTATTFHITIPVALRKLDDDHFLQLARQFTRFVRKQEQVPDWEMQALLTKYWVTTQGVALARRSSSR